jgi:hypothetical protein
MRTLTLILCYKISPLLITNKICSAENVTAKKKKKGGTEEDPLRQVYGPNLLWKMEPTINDSEV